MIYIYTTTNKRYTLAEGEHWGSTETAPSIVWRRIKFGNPVKVEAEYWDIETGERLVAESEEVTFNPDLVERVVKG